jgi:protein-tyrosine phosphatase
MVKNDKCLHPENYMDEIVPGLFLGSIEATYDLNILKANNIKYIICVMSEFNIPNYTELKYLHVPIKDNMVHTIDTNDLFNYTNNYIKTNLLKGNILVHCKKGHHRSASVVASYIFVKYGIELDVIINRINIVRKCAFRRDTSMVKLLKKYCDGL